MSPSEYVQVIVDEIGGVMDDEVHVIHQGRGHWLPKSHIVEANRLDKADKPTTIRITKMLAEAEGMMPQGSPPKSASPDRPTAKPSLKDRLDAIVKRKEEELMAAVLPLFEAAAVKAALDGQRTCTVQVETKGLTVEMLSRALPGLDIAFNLTDETVILRW